MKRSASVYVARRSWLQLMTLCAAGAVIASPSAAQFRQGTLNTTPVFPRTRVEAGVKVLEHDKTAFSRAAQLVLTGAPVTVAGGSEGDPAFDLTGVGQVVLLSDGRIVSYSSIGSRLMLFKTNGDGERVIGRPGKGPGEFMLARSVLSLSGDTLFLLDAGNSRLNWIHPDRGVIRDEPRGTNMRLDAEYAAGVLPGGRVVLTSTGLMEEFNDKGIIRPAASVTLMSHDGKVRKIAAVPDLELMNVETHFGGRPGHHAAMLRFSRYAQVIVWDTSIVTANGNGYSVDIRNSAGTVDTRIVASVARRPVTKAMRDAGIAAELKPRSGRHTEGMVDPKENERLIREQPVADSLPPYSRLFVSPNHTLWIVDYPAPGDTSWAATAFRKDGAILGRLQASGSGRPLAFGNDRVVIRTEDADGVVSLTVRRIAVK